MTLYVVISGFITGALALGLTWSYSQDIIKWALRRPSRISQEQRQNGLPLIMFAGLALSIVPGFWISLQDSVCLQLFTPLIMFVLVPVGGYLLLFWLAAVNLLATGIMLFFTWCNCRCGYNPASTDQELKEKP